MNEGRWHNLDEIKTYCSSCSCPGMNCNLWPTLWAKHLLSWVDSSFCLSSQWHYDLWMSVHGIFCREAHHLSLFLFQSSYLRGPHPHFLQGQSYLPSPFPAKHHWHSKQAPVPKLGCGHLFCTSLENAIKPAWRLCQQKGQRGWHGKKLCKIHFSRGSVKNIPSKSSNRKWSIVICLFLVSLLCIINGFMLVLSWYQLIIIRPYNCTVLYVFIKAFKDLLYL